jgi:hypothetical protein
MPRHSPTLLGRRRVPIPISLHLPIFPTSCPFSSSHHLTFPPSFFPTISPSHFPFFRLPHSEFPVRFTLSPSHLRNFHLFTFELRASLPLSLLAFSHLLSFHLQAFTFFLAPFAMRLVPFAYKLKTMDILELDFNIIHAKLKT